VPSRTGVNILPETYAQLAQHERIVAVKEANGNVSAIVKTAALCGDNLTIYSGDDDQATAIMSLGGKGVISVLSNVAPKAAHDIAQKFLDGDSILVVLNNGDFYITTPDPNNHFEDNIRIIEKYEADKVWTAVLFDADNKGYPYLKRFLMDASKKKQNYIGENQNSKLILLTDTVYPRIGVTFGGLDQHRQPLDIEAEDFTGVKSYKAHGKRLTTYAVESIVELEPTRLPEPETEEPETEEEEPQGQEEENLDPDAGKSRQQVIDEMTGQLSLFSDEDM
jgi:hypothetical protein